MNKEKKTKNIVIGAGVGVLVVILLVVMIVSKPFSKKSKNPDKVATVETTEAITTEANKETDSETTAKEKTTKESKTTQEEENSEDETTEEETTEEESQPSEAETTDTYIPQTQAPTVAPTVAPTQAPTVAPTQAPTQAPTVAPTVAPTKTPETKPAETKTQAQTTKAPTTAAPKETTTAVPTTAKVVHGKDGKILDTLAVYGRNGKSTVFPENKAAMTVQLGDPESFNLFSYEFKAAYAEDFMGIGFVFCQTTIDQVKEYFGEPYRVLGRDETTKSYTLLYRYKNSDLFVVINFFDTGNEDGTIGTLRMVLLGDANDLEDIL